MFTRRPIHTSQIFLPEDWQYQQPVGIWVCSDTELLPSCKHDIMRQLGIEVYVRRFSKNSPRTFPSLCTRCLYFLLLTYDYIYTTYIYYDYICFVVLELKASSRENVLIIDSWSSFSTSQAFGSGICILHHGLWWPLAPACTPLKVLKSASCHGLAGAATVVWRCEFEGAIRRRRHQL